MLLPLLIVLHFCTFSVHQERAESPTLSFVSAKSHQSMDMDEKEEEEDEEDEDKVEDSAQKEK